MQEAAIILGTIGIVWCLTELCELFLDNKNTDEGRPNSAKKNVPNEL